MDAYVYQAALYCEDCTRALKARRDVRRNQDEEDSGRYPQGPYSDGGGEADTPQHCDGCNTFLENPLTDDGHAYVVEAFKEHKDSGRGGLDVLTVWSKFYGIPLDGPDLSVVVQDCFANTCDALDALAAGNLGLVRTLLSAMRDELAELQPED